MMGGKWGTVCVVRGCPSRTTNKDIALFRFPKDAARCNVWIIACNREDLADKDPNHLYNNFRLCALHFEDNKFLDSHFFS